MINHHFVVNMKVDENILRDALKLVSAVKVKLKYFIRMSSTGSLDIKRKKLLLHIIFHNRILDVRILQCRHSFGFVPPLLKTLRTAMLQHHSNFQRKIIQIVS